MKRREFNKLAGLTLADLALGGSLVGCTTTTKLARNPSKSKGRIVACHAKTQANSSPVRILDWDTHRSTEFEIPLQLVHSVVQDRRDSNVLYFFEVFGSCVKVNLASGRTTKIDHKEGVAMFNGHGALTSSGELIACNEISPKTGATVRMRSTDDLSIVTELPPECRTCHQIVSLPGSSLMATGNMISGRGAITFYDYEKEMIVRRVETESPILHLIPISSHEVVGASFLDTKVAAPRGQRLESSNASSENLRMFTDGTVVAPSPLIYVSMEAEKKLLWDERRKELFNLNFGLAKSRDGRLFSSHVRSNKVIVWKNDAIERILDVPSPKNIQISDDESEFLVLSDGSLKLFSMQTYESLPSLSDWRNVVAISSYKA